MKENLLLLLFLLLVVFGGIIYYNNTIKNNDKNSDEDDDEKETLQEFCQKKDTIDLLKKLNDNYKNDICSQNFRNNIDIFFKKVLKSFDDILDNLEDELKKSIKLYNLKFYLTLKKNVNFNCDDKDICEKELLTFKLKQISGESYQAGYDSENFLFYLDGKSYDNENFEQAVISTNILFSESNYLNWNEFKYIINNIEYVLNEGEESIWFIDKVKISCKVNQIKIVKLLTPDLFEVATEFFVSFLDEKDFEEDLKTYIKDKYIEWETVTEIMESTLKNIEPPDYWDTYICNDLINLQKKYIPEKIINNAKKFYDFRKYKIEDKKEVIELDIPSLEC